MNGEHARRETTERLLDLLGQLPDDLLEEAARTEDRKDFERLARAEKEKHGEGEPWEEGAMDSGIKEPVQSGRSARQGWKRYSACAACLCLLLLGLAFWQPSSEHAGGGLETTAAGVQGEKGAGEDETAVPGEGVDMAAPENGGGTAAAGDGTGALEEGGPITAEEGGGLADGDGIDGVWEESGFWYADRRYMKAQEPLLSSLPENSRPVGVLETAGETSKDDWTTWAQELAGCQVYAVAGGAGDESWEDGILYVAQKDGYYMYCPKQE